MEHLQTETSEYNKTISNNHSAPINPVVIIPVYNNMSSIATVVHDVQTYLPDIIIIDDGSTDDTVAVCRELANTTLLRYPINKGKGAALRVGFQKARELGFSHAITVDADGQHLAVDIPAFLEKIHEEPCTLWIGDRIIPVNDGIDQPPRSRFGRHFGAFWYRLYTGQFIRDTQCGFRAYPIEAVEKLGCDSNRYEYEIEVLITAAWNHIPVKSIPVHLLYQPPEQRVSHFRPFRDFMRISMVNSRAAITRIFFPPQLIDVPGLRIRKKLKYILKKELTANATPFKAALSFSVGVTMAVSPFHGLQVITLLSLAFIFKLNRPLALLGVSVSSAPLIPLWIAAGLWLGKLIVPLDSAIHMANTLESILPDTLLSFIQNKTISGFLHGFIQWFIGTLVLAPICGIVAFVLTLPIFRMFRKARSKQEY